MTVCGRECECVPFVPGHEPWGVLLEPVFALRAFNQVRMLSATTRCVRRAVLASTHPHPIFCKRGDPPCHQTHCCGPAFG